MEVNYNVFISKYFDLLLNAKNFNVSSKKILQEILINDNFI